MMRVRALPLFLACLALPPLTHGDEIRVVGTDLLGPAVRSRFETFARENDVRVTLQLEGTRPGLDRLRAGDADLGFFLVPPGETASPEPFVSRVIAYQPVLFVTSPQLPLRQLTVAQVRGMFATTGGGNYGKWGDLGLTEDWRLATIELQVTSPRDTLTLPLLRRLLLDGVALKPHATLAPLDRVLDRVRASPNSIGVVPFVPAADGGLRVLALAATVQDAAHLPTAENLHDGSYPARIPLSIVFRREAAPRLLVLLRHLLGEEGGDALAKAGFVPLPVSPRNQLMFELEELN